MVEYIRHCLMLVIRFKYGKIVVFLLAELRGAILDLPQGTPLVPTCFKYFFFISFSSCSKFVFIVSKCIDVVFECF